MSRYLLALLLLVGCAKPAEPQVSLFEVFHVTDHEGAGIPDHLTLPAGGALDLSIAYKALPVQLPGDRPVRSPEEWRFWQVVQDSSGKVWDYGLQFFELLPYEEMGMEGTTKGLETTIHWVSPEKPPKAGEDLITRWGRVRLPMEPGDYTLSLKAYPTAVPRSPAEEFRDLGVGFEVLKLRLTLVSPEPGKEPIRPTDIKSIVATGRLRRLQQQTFGRLSDELRAEMKQR
jgi:hypothetical protein